MKEKQRMKNRIEQTLFWPPHIYGQGFTPTHTCTYKIHIHPTHTHHRQRVSLYYISLADHGMYIQLSLPAAIKNYPGKSNLMEKGLIVAVWGCSLTWQWEPEAAGLHFIHSKEAERNEWWPSVCSLVFIYPGLLTLAHERVLPPFKVGLYNSVKTI